MSKILVTPRSLTSADHPALDRLRAAGFEVVFSSPGRQPTEQELLALVPGCVGYLAGVEKVTAEVLNAATDLKVISRNGVGVDNVDLDTAKRLNIRVCPAPGANARGVAELTIALILSLARSIPLSDRMIKGGDWQRRKGFELEGKTLGLVGCGRIGRLVAQMAIGIGMKVIAYDVCPDATFQPGGSFRFASLAEVLQRSDVISLHCPPPAEGTAVIDGDALKRTRKGVYLINTARYDLVDPVALAEQLEDGHVAGAALDVFAIEPPTDGTLTQNDRVVATPHIGGFTAESVDRAVQMAVDNLLDALHTTGTGA
ncbi:MAG: oxidoreductase [Planctomycetes bacterium RBG_13_63_9]|nr:MAG: oxidoreductase [Planctomycetes bacterium RBG_13_63_9]